MKTLLYRPKPPVDYPQVAALEVLRGALAPAAAILAMTHQELFDNERPAWLPPLSRDSVAARRLLQAIGRLRTAIHRYEALVVSDSDQPISCNYADPF